MSSDEKDQEKSSSNNKNNEDSGNSSTETDQKKDPLYNPEVLTKRKVIINTSTSKAMYQFSTTDRFKTEEKDQSSFYYNLPSTLSKRSASIGYGQKAQINILKPLNDKIYDIYRGFDGTKRSGSPKYTFGYGRDVCKINKSKNETNLPGPFSYSPYKSFGENALKYTMSSRYNNKNTPLNVPGPASYNFHYDNKFGNSTLINSRKTKFSNEMRFKPFKSSSEVNTPGPGAYGVEGINGKGNIFNSRYETNLGKSMGMRLAKVGEKLITPGPGAYDFFSDFEGFGKYRFKIKKDSSKEKSEKDESKNED